MAIGTATITRRAVTVMSSDRTVTPSSSCSIRRTGADSRSASPIVAAIGPYTAPMPPTMRESWEPPSTPNTNWGPPPDAI